MNENAITFDYKTVKVKREMEVIVGDAYENLGWELVSSNSAEGSPFEVILSFKRDRKIENKIGLLKLQQKIDLCLAEIDTFQRKRKTGGIVAGISMGVVSALTFGGGLSMCLCLKGLGFMLGGIAIGLVGVGLGFLSWVIAKKVAKKKNEDLTPIIEQEFDNLADLCETARNIVDGKN